MADLPGIGCQDAHVRRCHGVGDVLGETGDPGHLDPGTELELVAGDGGPDPAADQPGLDPVGGERPHQVLAGSVDLALVVAQLLRRLQQGDARQHPFPRGTRGGGHGCRGHRHRLGLERDVDVRVVLVGRMSWSTVVSSGTTGTGAREADTSASSATPSGAVTNGLPRHSVVAVRPAAAAVARQRPGDRGQGHTGRDEDRHDDDGHQQHRGTGRAQPGMEGASDRRSEVAAGVAQRVRGRQARRALGQLGQSADAEQPEHRPDGQAPRIGAVVARLVVLPAAVDEQRDAGADGHEREDDAGPSGEQCQPRVGAVPDGTQLLAPQRQRQQDAQRDQADGPQVSGLDPPERRPRRSGPLRP